MKYYSREVTKREPINRFGKLGFVLYKEMVKTNDIDKFNKNKRIKFTEDEEARKYLYHKNSNIIYSEKNNEEAANGYTFIYNTSYYICICWINKEELKNSSFLLLYNIIMFLFYVTFRKISILCNNTLFIRYFKTFLY